MTVNPLDLHWAIKGNFLLNCNCDVFCNCPMSLGRAVPNSPNGKCFSWWRINIEEGYAEEKWSGFNPIKRESKGIIDLDGLNVGHTIHISAIELPEGCTPTITDRDFTVATIAAPRGGLGDDDVDETEEATEDTEEGTEEDKSDS